MLPWLASHSMASRRWVVSALLSAATASACDFGGAGNAGAAASVSAAAGSRMTRTILAVERESTMKIKSALGILALLFAAHAFAADTPGTAATASDPLMERYQAAAANQDWKAAAVVMQEALGANSRNADYHSLYAYSLRRSGSDQMDQVFKHYNE